MSASHTTIRTPNPAERSLVVTVPESVFAAKGGVIPPQGTLYGSSAFKTYFGKDYMKEFSEFVYTEQVGEYGLAFAMNKTPEEANTPFRTYTVDFGNHHWAPVLYAFNLIEDTSFPVAVPTIVGNDQGLVITPRWYERQEFVDAINEGTRFVLYEFFGPTPFGIPRHSVPQPLSIQYTLPGGGGGSFPASYHDTFTVPGMRSGTFQSAGGTTAAVEGGGQDEQIFPRTNHKRRRPYVVKDGNAFRDGGYYRAMLRAFPPAPGRKITRNA
jgi:hypothetical protein